MLAFALIALASTLVVSATFAFNASSASLADAPAASHSRSKVLGDSIAAGFYPYPSGSLVVDTDGTIYFITDYFSNKIWRLKEDLIAEKKLRSTIQAKIPPGRRPFDR